MRIGVPANGQDYGALVAFWILCLKMNGVKTVRFKPSSVIPGGKARMIDGFAPDRSQDLTGEWTDGQEESSVRFEMLGQLGEQLDLIRWREVKEAVPGDDAVEFL